MIGKDKSVFEFIVPAGICVGCGMCAGIYPSDLRMIIDRRGWYLPEALNDDIARWGEGSLSVCPFSDTADNEDIIGERLFGGDPGIQHRSETGYYLECSACHVKDENARMSSSSGGLATWLILKLLERGKVQGAVCVAPSGRGDRLFDFDLMTSTEDVRKAAGSRYYPVEMSDAIRGIREFDGRVVVTGVPCFIKALRLACEADKVLAGRIAYTIGLFCGHLKSMRYVDYLARSCGIAERDVITVDFRRKIEDSRANNYGIEMTFEEGGGTSRRTIRAKEVWGGSWTNNIFMLPACEYCDDVFSETADIALGDAWLPEYVSDWRGTNIAVCRNGAIAEIMREGSRKGEIVMKEIPIESVIKSQGGALRQRREGLKYRLYLSEKRGVRRPVKRVEPEKNAGSFLDRILQRQRMRIAAMVHGVFLEQLEGEGLSLFKSRLRSRIFLSGCINQLRHLPKSVRHKIRSLSR